IDYIDRQFVHEGWRRFFPGRPVTFPTEHAFLFPLEARLLIGLTQNETHRVFRDEYLVSLLSQPERAVLFLKLVGEILLLPLKAPDDSLLEVLLAFALK